MTMSDSIRSWSWGGNSVIKWSNKNKEQWGWTWGSGIIYSLSNGTVVASTTGNRGLASTGTGADKTYETSQVIDPVTWNTISQTFWPWGTVVFDDTDINFENWTTLNYDSTVVSNHTGDTINYDSTTTVEWGVFTNNTFNNPTFTGNIGISDRLVNEIKTGWVAGAFTLANTPSGNIQVSIIWWLIQVPWVDYTHIGNSTSFTTLIDTTWDQLLVTYYKQ